MRDLPGARPVWLPTGEDCRSVLQGEGPRALDPRRSIEELEWALTLHLLPYFASFPLAGITVADVDRHKRAKVAEREEAERLRAILPEKERRKVRPGLSNRTINRTLLILSQCLDYAAELGLVGSNPAKGRKRRLKAEPQRRASMDAEQVRALLDAADDHRTLLATAIMAGGLRASELTGLRWRDVDLAGGWLHVRESKTEAGVRRIDLAPHLLDELKASKADAADSSPEAFAFPTREGTRRDRNTFADADPVPGDQAGERKARRGGPPADPRGRDVPLAPPDVRPAHGRGGRRPSLRDGADRPPAGGVHARGVHGRRRPEARRERTPRSPPHGA